MEKIELFVTILSMKIQLLLLVDSYMEEDLLFYLMNTVMFVNTTISG